MELYIDDYLINEGFGSTEIYLDFCKEVGRIPVFKGHKYFMDMFEKHRIIPGLSYIRIKNAYSGPDELYSVTEKGELKGIPANHNPGKTGIHRPEDILAIESAPAGWELDGWFFPDRRELLGID
jgi:hypothetical protein